MDLQFETERLIVRPFDERDVDDHVAMMRDPRIAEYLTQTGEPSEGTEEWRKAATLLGHWQIRSFGLFSVIEKETGDWVGRVGPHRPAGWPGVECTWAIISRKWGLNYAAEASIPTIKWIMDQQSELQEVFAIIDPINIKAQSVAVKVGAQKSGKQFEIWGFKHDIWVIKRDEWRARFVG